MAVVAADVETFLDAYESCPAEIAGTSAGVACGGTDEIRKLAYAILTVTQEDLDARITVLENA